MHSQTSVMYPARNCTVTYSASSSISKTSPKKKQNKNHSLILSFSHSLILSFSHSLTLSLSHSLTLSLSHFLTLSPSHPPYTERSRSVTFSTCITLKKYLSFVNRLKPERSLDCYKPSAVLAQRII